MPEATVSIAGSQSILALFGPRDQHLRRIRTELGWTPTVGFTELITMMVDADLARLAGR